MSGVILDGKKTALEIRSELESRIAVLKKGGVTPGLTAVLVGDDPASATYVASKARMCEELGIRSQVHRLEGTTSQDDLLKTIAGLNRDEQTHGILVQFPLPPQIDPAAVIEAIDPDKDVDGFHPVSRGRLQANQDTFLPCTPAGIIELLKRNGVVINGRHVVVLGRSLIVGLPLAMMLVQKKESTNATVTICHSGTKNLPEMAAQADILVAAIGRAEFVTADMVKPGAVVVDVGINRKEDATRPKGYRVVGDVAFDSVKDKTSAISPVPGGVGPMTIIMLMHNTVRAAESRMRQ